MDDTVIFDLFGVIAHNQSAQGRTRLAAIAAVDEAADAGFWDAYWRLRPPYDKGLTSGREYWHQVAAAMSTTFGDQQVTELITADIASWSAVDDTVIELLGDLAASGQRLALLSNIPEELAAHYEAHHPWLDCFQLRAFSCRIGYAKPQPAAFTWCLDALAVPAGRVLFVDDRRDNVRAAQSLGIEGHLFTAPARLRRHLDDWSARNGRGSALAERRR